MSYKVTVRRGPKVEHEQYETLNQALSAVERHAHGRTRPIEALGRRYEPKDIVAARIELKGPKTKAGVDVRGDGTLVAWTGRVVRKPNCPATTRSRRCVRASASARSASARPSGPATRARATPAAARSAASGP